MEYFTPGGNIWRPVLVHQFAPKKDRPCQSLLRISIHISSLYITSFTQIFWIKNIHYISLKQSWILYKIKIDFKINLSIKSINYCVIYTFWGRTVVMANFIYSLGSHASVLYYTYIHNYILIFNIYIIYS